MLILFLAVSGCFIELAVQLQDYQVREPQNALGTTFLVLVIAVAVAWLVYFFAKEKPDSLANDGDPMPIVTRRVLAFYLLFTGIVLVGLLWRIGSIDFSDAGLEFRTEELNQKVQTAAASSIQSGSAATTTSGSPVLYGLFTQATLTATPVLYITAYGDHFTAESKVRFNQQTGRPSIVVGSSTPALAIAKEVKRGLSTVADVVVWDTAFDAGTWLLGGYPHSCSAVRLWCICNP